MWMPISEAVEYSIQHSDRPLATDINAYDPFVVARAHHDRVHAAAAVTFPIVDALSGANV